MLALLGRILSGDIQRFVVAHKDRLARFGSSTCFNSCANKTGVNSWFSMNQVSLLNEKWLKISSPLFFQPSVTLFSHSGQIKRAKHCGIYTLGFDDGLLAAMLRPYTIKAFGIFPSESDGRAVIDEAHKQIVCYLTDNYRVIFIPTFETSQMVAKARRKIRSKTVRSMLSWVHYRFDLFLNQKAEMTNTIVITGSEAYTSKTCTKCGHIL